MPSQRRNPIIDADGTEVGRTRERRLEINDVRRVAVDRDNCEYKIFGGVQSS